MNKTNNVLAVHVLNCGCTTEVRVSDCPVYAVMCDHNYWVAAGPRNETTEITGSILIAAP